MQLQLNEVFHFDKSHELFYSIIKKIISIQGALTCRDFFDHGYINHCLETFTDGFIIVGDKSNNHDRYFLKGYVLFIYDFHSSTIQGKIICANKNYRCLGRELLDNVKEFAINRKVTEWQIFSLPYERLKIYYESYGFTYIDTIYKEGKAKVYKMIYKFDYSIQKNAIPIKDLNITIRINQNNEDTIVSSSNYDYMLGVLTILKIELAYSETIFFTYEDSYSKSLFVEDKIYSISYVKNGINDENNLDEDVTNYEYNFQYISKDNMLISQILLTSSDVEDINSFIDGLCFVVNTLESNIELV